MQGLRVRNIIQWAPFKYTAFKVCFLFHFSAVILEQAEHSNMSIQQN